MSTFSRPFDAVVEFTLSPERKAPLTVAEIRAPLFWSEANEAVSVLLDVADQVPLRPGETCTASAWFLNPDEARLRLPPGAAFRSFEINGKILHWREELAAAE